MRDERVLRGYGDLMVGQLSWNVLYYQGHFTEASKVVSRIACSCQVQDMVIASELQQEGVY